MSIVLDGEEIEFDYKGRDMKGTFCATAEFYYEKSAGYCQGLHLTELYIEKLTDNMGNDILEKIKKLSPKDFQVISEDILKIMVDEAQDHYD